jgi:hypothetical protein
MNDTFQVEHVAEAPSSVPSSVPETVDAPEDHRAVERQLDDRLRIIAEEDSPGAMQAYIDERRDREDIKRGDKSYLDADRTERRYARTDAINRARAETELALLDTQQPQQADDTELQELQQAHYRAQALAETYDDPQYLVDVTAEAVQREGHLKPYVQKALGSARHINEISLEIAENAGAITKLNSLSPIEAARVIAHADGFYAAHRENGTNPRQQQQAPEPVKKVSSAPRPVPQVTGKAHSNAKSYDDMSYEEYRSAREKQIQKARGR